MMEKNSAPVKAAVSSTLKRKVKLWNKFVEKDDEEEETRIRPRRKKGGL
ncbi:hypothetical protein PgNI_06254 [Pyricularia grisea]|uniref:Uncharacterized protein n=1 Tax=Pyricularia grisea TaxID=148305 RepID=A0A6P8B7I6_PYRGI|nr:hypothetical protein PgNI_06254 [Pyricularia grisea]TLD11235.1 hypothetical protein PgNI_06254 [Pyricularia grisea]